MTPPKHPISHRPPSPSPTPERRSLSSATLPMELKERLARKRCIAVSSPDVAEEADDHYWRQALKQRARVCGHVSSAGYDIEVIDSDALRRAVSQVKWPTPTPRVQPSSISSMAPPLISSGSLSTISILHRHRVPFVIFEGHVL